jgi:membrane-bound serine protease (ClpP class)
VLLIAAILAAFFFVPSPWGLVVVIVAALIEVGESVFWVRFSQRRRARVGAEALEGAEGIVTEPCNPAGRVRVQGELWQARCEPPAEAGERVRVIGRDGLVLRVEPVRDAK